MIIYNVIKEVQKELILILKEIKIITNHNIESYVKSGVFTDQGERAVEAMLLAVILFII